MGNEGFLITCDIFKNMVKQIVCIVYIKGSAFEMMLFSFQKTPKYPD